MGISRRSSKSISKKSKGSSSDSTWSSSSASASESESSTSVLKSVPVEMSEEVDAPDDKGPEERERGDWSLVIVVAAAPGVVVEVVLVVVMVGTRVGGGFCCTTQVVAVLMVDGILVRGLMVLDPEGDDGVGLLPPLMLGRWEVALVMEWGDCGGTTAGVATGTVPWLMRVLLLVIDVLRVDEQ